MRLAEGEHRVVPQAADAAAEGGAGAPCRQAAGFGGFGGKTVEAGKQGGIAGDGSGRSGWEEEQFLLGWAQWFLCGKNDDGQ